MISDKDPVKAVTYLSDLQLFWVVFSLPHNSEPTIMEGTDRFGFHNLYIIFFELVNVK